MAPRPPRMLVPPTTTAAIGGKTTSPSPSPAIAVPVREIRIAPATPAAKPLNANAPTRTARVLMPDSRAASALPPVA